MFQLFIDGVNQGYVQNKDADSSDNDYSLRDLGTVKFANPGEKAFQFWSQGGIQVARNITSFSITLSWC